MKAGGRTRRATRLTAQRSASRVGNQKGMVMPELVGRVSWALAWMLALSLVGCAAPTDEQADVEPPDVADESAMGGMAGQGGVVEDAEQDDVQASSQSLT